MIIFYLAPVVNLQVIDVEERNTTASEFSSLDYPPLSLLLEVTLALKFKFSTFQFKTYYITNWTRLNFNKISLVKFHIKFHPSINDTKTFTV